MISSPDLSRPARHSCKRPSAGSAKAGYALLPTYAAPHYDLLLRSAGYDDAIKLLNVFSESRPNPHKRRR